ncbi:hypothetical protein JOB18_003044 [Solea senegalensis]|uniref:Uncharacterized protein n=1 Tax=Solea senegalensis TaxID=28829 RepID=A0AAV6Q3H3_SOLSE|nr:hypothetical protein JOB18_003044 [Solea senegalensis]
MNQNSGQTSKKVCFKPTTQPTTVSRRKDSAKSLTGTIGHLEAFMWRKTNVFLFLLFTSGEELQRGEEGFPLVRMDPPPIRQVSRRLCGLTLNRSPPQSGWVSHFPPCAAGPCSRSDLFATDFDILRAE